MRFALAAFFFAAVASSASALSLNVRQGVPQCGLTCLTNANFGGCASNDNACLCKSPEFVTSTTQCIESSCTGSDLQQAEQFAQQTCLAVGVTLTSSIPAATSTSTSSSASPSQTSNAAFAHGASLNHLAVAGALGLAVLAL